MGEDNKNLINNEILSQLSEKERELALSILEQYSKTGESEIFQGLLAEDYKELPVDIMTFILDNRYLGKAWHDAEGKIKLYEYWEKKVKLLFPDAYSTEVNNLIISGARGLGKAQPLDSLILAAGGYKRMGDITLGEKVYGADGQLHEVIGIFPQGIKDVYRISFTDGTSTLCCKDHLWNVNSRKSPTGWKTYSLEELQHLTLIDTKRGTQEHKRKIPLCVAIPFEHKEVFIDPYLMGVLLGDGSFGNTLKFTTADKELGDTINLILGTNGYKLSSYTKEGTLALDFGVVRQHKKNSPNDYTVELERLNLLHKDSYTKFIPDIYLYNDVESRLAILQGLLDTDGWIDKAGLVYFNTISPQLRDGVKFIVQSLGGVVKVRTKQGKYKKNGEVMLTHINYDMTITLPKQYRPFRLTRKLERLNSKTLGPSRFIDKIELVGQDECQCIMIDGEEHLYLTNDFIATHNSEIAVAIMLYLMYRVMCLKDPQQHFKLKPTEKICFAFMNITKTLAEEIGVSKFQNTVRMSPWFMEKGSMTQKNNEPYWIAPDPIEVIIGSQASHVIGQPIFAAFFDEISFIRNQDIDKQKRIAMDMIDTAIGGMKTRFIHKGKNPTLLILASSKRSEKSFLEEHMKKKLKSEQENVMIVDEAVWAVKPKGTYDEKTFKVALGNKFLQSVVIPDGDDLAIYQGKGYKIIDVPIDFRADFMDDIDRALTDFAGISSSEISKYISGIAVKDIINYSLKNPFTKEILEIGNAKEDEVQYKDFFDLTRVPAEMKAKPLFIHLDMSVSGDMTGIAGTWIKGKKISTTENQSRDLFFTLAFAVSIKAPKGRQISFEKNRNFIYWLKEQGFNIKGITSDTYQSYDTGQTLKAKGYPYEVLSVDKVDTDKVNKPYQYFKSTIYEKRMEMFDSPSLVEELIDLERNINTGKVDHPTGGRKDVSDAVCGSLYNASKNAEQFAFEWGETLDTIYETNKMLSDDTIRQQITLEFEEELKKTFNPLGGGQKPNKTPQPITNIPNGVNPHLKDGILIW